MIENSRSLLSNISKKAPWLIDGEGPFTPITAGEKAHRIIECISDYHLTIITDKGRVYRQYLMIGIEDGMLKIDKPFKWIDAAESFHVFFRKDAHNWCFFPVNQARTEVSTINARIPDKVYILARRKHHRVPTPLGTKAIFKNHNGLIDIMHVKNISEGGMLICDNSLINRYPPNSAINEIFLTVPPHHAGNEEGTAHRVLPFITSGKIVRSSQDQSSSVSCYAVSFQHENLHLSKRFRQVISNLENSLR